MKIKNLFKNEEVLEKKTQGILEKTQGTGGLRLAKSVQTKSL